MSEVFIATLHCYIKISNLLEILSKLFNKEYEENSAKSVKGWFFFVD